MTTTLAIAFATWAFGLCCGIVVVTFATREEVEDERI